MAEPRYIVKAQFKYDGMVIVYSGSNGRRATEIANFWDERVDVEFTDTYNETPLGRAMRRFDEAIAKLSR